MGLKPSNKESKAIKKIRVRWGEHSQEIKGDGIKARLSSYEGRLHIKSRSLWLKDLKLHEWLYKDISYL